MIFALLNTPLFITRSAGISSPSARTDGGQAMSTAVVTLFVVAGIVIGPTGLIVMGWGVVLLKTGKDRKDSLMKLEQLGCCSISTRAIWQSTRTGGGWEL